MDLTAASPFIPLLPLAQVKDLSMVLFGMSAVLNWIILVQVCCTQRECEFEAPCMRFAPQRLL